MVELRFVFFRAWLTAPQFSFDDDAEKGTPGGGHPVGWRNPACKIFKKFGLAGSSNIPFSSKYIYIYIFNVCVFFIVYFVVDHWEVSIKVTIVFVFLLVPSSPPFLLRGRQGGQVAGKDQQVFQEDPVCPCSSPRVSWQNFVGCVTV